MSRVTRWPDARRSRLVALAMLMAVAGGACNVPKDDEARPIDPARLDTATSSKRNCTSPGVDGESLRVQVYLVSTQDAPPTVAPVDRIVQGTAPTPEQALDALFTCKVTTEESSRGLATSVPEETQLLGLVEVAGSDGLYEVRLGPLQNRGAKQVDDLDKLAVAQIFFTTQGLTPEVKGLRFTIDGRPKAVSTDQRTVGTGPNDFVRRADFKSSSPLAGTETRTTVTNGTNIVGATSTTR